MGSPAGPLNRKRLIEGHIASMRRYADELDTLEPMIKRRDVVNRILSCASEIETMHNLMKVDA